MGFSRSRSPKLVRRLSFSDSVCADCIVLIWLSDTSFVCRVLTSTGSTSLSTYNNYTCTYKTYHIIKLYHALSAVLPATSTSMINDFCCARIISNQANHRCPHNNLSFEKCIKDSYSLLECFDILSNRS